LGCRKNAIRSSTPSLTPLKSGSLSEMGWCWTASASDSAAFFVLRFSSTPTSLLDARSEETFHLRAHCRTKSVSRTEGAALLMRRSFCASFGVERPAPDRGEGASGFALRDQLRATARCVKFIPGGAVEETGW